MVYLEKYYCGFNTLIGRKFYVELNNYFSQFFDVTSSVLQGSKLGPLLNIIYTNDIANLFNFAKIKMYADDFTYMYVLIMRWTELNFIMS